MEGVEDCGGRGKVCGEKGGVLEGMRCVKEGWMWVVGR